MTNTIGKAFEKTEKKGDTVSKNAPNKDKKHDNRNRHNHHQKDGKKTPDRIPQKDDIYGDPKEERELAEWRAKIVLNSSAEKETATDEPIP